MSTSVRFQSCMKEFVDCPVCGFSERGAVYASGPDFEYDTVLNEFSFVRCSACGVLYLNPRPAVSELSKIYPPEYAPYHFDNNTSFTVRIRNWLETRKAKAFLKIIPETAEILDGGCGGTSFLNALRQAGPPGWHLWGNDFDTAALERIKKENFNALPGRFEELSGFDNFFDVIFLKQVIEHLARPVDVMSSAAKMLKPGGYLVVDTPNENAWDAKWFAGRYWGGYHFPRHWTLFNRKALSQLGQKVGLEVQAVSYMLSPTFWVQSVHHLLKDHHWPGCTQRFFSHVNPLAMAAACTLDVLQKIILEATSNMRILFQKK